MSYIWLQSYHVSTDRHLISQTYNEETNSRVRRRVPLKFGGRRAVLWLFLLVSIHHLCKVQICPRLLPNACWEEQWRHQRARTLAELCSLSAGPAPDQTAAQTSQRISLRDRRLPSPKTSILGGKGACNIELGFATQTYFSPQRSVSFLFPGSPYESRKSLESTPLKEFCFLRNYKGLGEHVDPGFHP